VKTAVLGASGFIGRHAWKSYRQSFPDCLGTACSNLRPDMTRFDIRESNLASLRLGETGHQAVLIASAVSSNEYCERRSAEAYDVNVRGTLEIIRQLGQTPLQVIFLSSDYVFDGRTGRYRDGDETCPVVEYGRQKSLVEKEIPSLVDDYLILRLSRVYGVQKADGTLLDEMACSFAAGRAVEAAADQFFCPTLVAELVSAIQAIQGLGLKGLMNLCSGEVWSRYDIARAMAAAMHVDPKLVKKISLDKLPTMKGRPRNTSIVCTRLQEETEVSFTPLRDCILRVAANWSEL